MKEEKESRALSSISYRYRYPPHPRSYPIANPRSGAAAAPDSSHARRRGHEGVHGSLAATCSGAVAVQGDVEAPATHSNAGTHGAGHACVGTRTGNREFSFCKWFFPVQGSMWFIIQHHILFENVDTHCYQVKISVHIGILLSMKQRAIVNNWNVCTTVPAWHLHREQVGKSLC